MSQSSSSKPPKPTAPKSSKPPANGGAGKKPMVDKALAAKRVSRLPEDADDILTLKERLLAFWQILSTPRMLTSLLGVLMFALLTFALSFGYLAVDTVINDHGISKRNFRAPYAIEVEDVEETQRRKDEARLKVDADPVYLATRPFNETIETNLYRLLDQVSDFRKDVQDFDAKTKEGPDKKLPAAKKKAWFKQRIKQRDGLLDSQIDQLVMSDNPGVELVRNRILAVPISNNAWYKIKSAVEYTVVDKLVAQGITSEDYLVRFKPMINEAMPPSLSPNEKELVSTLVASVVVPNKRLDDDEMARRRNQAASSVSPVVRKFRKGEKIINEGERATPITVRALEAIGQQVQGVNWTACIGVAILAGFFSLLAWLYLTQCEGGKFFTPNYAGMIVTATCLFAAMFVGVARLSSIEGYMFSLYLFPLSCYALLLTIFTSQRLGIAFTTLLVFLLVMTLKVPVYPMGVMLFSSYVAVYVLTTRQYLTDRGQLLWVGICASASHILLVGAIELIMNNHAWQQSHHMTQVLVEMAIGGIKGLFITILTLGMLPIFESSFGMVTPYMLMELANHDKPLLKRMQFEAPGTFHHSLMVASLSEAAAESIGANAMLTRVGSLYHDIGKMKRPLFFIENQAYFGVENPHDKLSPRLSKMVITAHPRDSLEMARHHRLPVCIQDFMTEHHGTMITAYFYNQACAQEGEDNVSKDQFRYAGPRPQRKETAIVMMADACESAVRALKNPTPGQIEERIDKIVQARIDDGQFDECPITFEDIATVKLTFLRVLRGIQHNRIEYQQNLLKDLGKRLPEPGKPNLARLQQALVGGVAPADGAAAPTPKPADSKKQPPASA